MRIEGLSGNSGVMIKETFCTIRCTSKLAAWTERLKCSIYGSLYILLKKVSSAETKLERGRFEIKRKTESVCLKEAGRLTALCCDLHPNYDVQLDSDVNIMAFICVVYASIQRCCSRILTYL